MLDASHRIDDFEIIRPLGRGGMGVVYEAQQLNPSRRVALKVLAPWLAQDEEALQRFRREVDVLAQLDHPGIVHVISTGRTAEGVAYYTMKLIRGTSLAELMRHTAKLQNGDNLAPTRSLVEPADETPSLIPVLAIGAIGLPDSPPREIVHEYSANRFAFVVRVGVAAARALHAAHQQGHLHRDIKPSNLMIDHHGQLYLVDFGLTRALKPTSDVTCVGAIRGTPWYMSPEQARGDPLDQRSDIYSLGLAMYELASGGTGPFTANRDDADSVLKQVRSGMHLPLRVVAPSIPRDLEQIILRAIHPKSKRRFQNAAELAAELERILPSASGAVTPSKSRVPHRRIVVSRKLALSVVAGLVLLIAMAVFARRGPDKSTDAPAPPVTQTNTPPPGIALTNPPLATEDYPQMLRTPPPATAVPLLKGDMTPVWENRRVLGNGSINGLPGVLLIASLNSSLPTAIALADSTQTDPARPWFEFTVEMQAHGSDSPDGGQLGFFWGHRSDPTNPAGRRQFFVAQLDVRPVLKDRHGRLNIGSSLVQLPDEAGTHGAVTSWLRPLPRGKGLLALREPDANKNAWHRLRVRVVDHNISVTVDEGNAVEFSAGWLIASDSWLNGSSLDPRGEMGVWVRNGSGSFRNATFIALSGK